MTSMSFRASPWVTYQHPDSTTTTDPDPGQTFVFNASNTSETTYQQPEDLGAKTMVMDMDMDVDMEAPQISTLRDEESPPPPPAAPTPSKKTATPRKPRTPKVKVTPAAAATGAVSGSGEGSARKAEGSAGQGKLEDEREEDQLIDDDVPAPSVAGRTPEATPKKKAPVKRKTKKEKEKELKQQLEHQAPTDGLKKMETVENAVATPSNSSSQHPTDADVASNPSSLSAGESAESSSQIVVEGSNTEPVILKLSTAGKKKQATPRKTTSTPRGRGRGGRTKAALIAHVLAAEDAATSEAGYTGTAPSSPATAQMDLQDANEAGTPEPDHATVAASSPPLTSVPLAASLEDATSNLENVAIPQYPLPTRPFPVQPPVKIPSGFAPSMQLDKSRNKVRHWRTANREIRGIAGGRWFAKTWVGDKESEYASAHGTSEDGPMKHPIPGAAALSGTKLGHHLMSASAPVGRGRGRGGSKAASSVAASAVQSRASSVLGEPSVSVARPPTKMRILQLAPSENGDSDMAPPDS